MATGPPECAKYEEGLKKPYRRRTGRKVNGRFEYSKSWKRVRSL